MSASARLLYVRAPKPYVARVWEDESSRSDVNEGLRHLDRRVCRDQWRVVRLLRKARGQ